MASEERRNPDWLEQTVTFRANMKAAGSPLAYDQVESFDIYLRAILEAASLKFFTITWPADGNTATDDRLSGRIAEAIIFPGGGDNSEMPIAGTTITTAINIPADTRVTILLQ